MNSEQLISRLKSGWKTHQDQEASLRTVTDPDARSIRLHLDEIARGIAAATGQPAESDQVSDVVDVPRGKRTTTYRLKATLPAEMLDIEITFSRGQYKFEGSDWGDLNYLLERINDRILSRFSPPERTRSY